MATAQCRHQLTEIPIRQPSPQIKTSCSTNCVSLVIEEEVAKYLVICGNSMKIVVLTDLAPYFLND